MDIQLRSIKSQLLSKNSALYRLRSVTSTLPLPSVDMKCVQLDACQIENGCSNTFTLTFIEGELPPVQLVHVYYNLRTAGTQSIELISSSTYEVTYSVPTELDVTIRVCVGDSLVATGMLTGYVPLSKAYEKMSFLQRDVSRSTWCADWQSIVDQHIKIAEFVGHALAVLLRVQRRHMFSLAPVVCRILREHEGVNADVQCRALATLQRFPAAEVVAVPDFHARLLAGLQSPVPAVQMLSCRFVFYISEQSNYADRLLRANGLSDILTRCCGQVQMHAAIRQRIINLRGTVKSKKARRSQSRRL